jgi:acetolactate synthase-1/2/3 large subunit
MSDPEVDLCQIAAKQGVEGEGPVTNVADLEAAIPRGLAAVRAGRPYLINAHVIQGYANPPLARGD